ASLRVRHSHRVEQTKKTPPRLRPPQAPETTASADRPFTSRRAVRSRTGAARSSRTSVAIERAAERRGYQSVRGGAPKRNRKGPARIRLAHLRRAGGALCDSFGDRPRTVACVRRGAEPR